MVAMRTPLDWIGEAKNRNSTKEEFRGRLPSVASEQIERWGRYDGKRERRGMGEGENWENWEIVVRKGERGGRAFHAWGKELEKVVRGIVM